MAVVVLCFGLMAKVGAVVGFGGFQMGSVEKVGDQCAQNSLEMYIYVFQDSAVSLQWAGHYYNTNSLQFNHMDEVQAFFQQQLQLLLQRIAVSNNPSLSKSSPFWFYAWTSKYNGPLNANINYLGIPTTYFSFMKIGNNYYPPNTSGMNLQFLDAVAYDIPQLSWGRMTVTNIANSTYQVYDPLLNTNDTYYVDSASDLILVPLQAALSGTNGSFRTKISLVSRNSKIFQTFDSMGNLAKEELPSITSLNRTSLNTVNLGVNGGEVGRIFQALSGPTPQGPWTMNGNYQSMSPARSLTFPVIAPINTNHLFFKLRSTNGVPSY